MDNDLTLKAACLEIGLYHGSRIRSIVDPKKMVKPYVAGSLDSPRGLNAAHTWAEPAEAFGAGFPPGSNVHGSEHIP